MKNMKYYEIIKANRDIKNDLGGKEYKIKILSNIIMSQLNDILEYYLRNEKINTYVESGNYNNIQQDSLNCNKINLVIIFWELINIIEGMQYKANIMNAKEINSLISKIKNEIDFVLSNLKKSPLVLFNKFSSIIFNYNNIIENNLDKIVKNLNKYLEQKKSSNIILIDIDNVIAKISIQKAIDFRFYYSSKTLYSIEFYKKYVEYIKQIILTISGKKKKAIIFDCDNTLWNGILGEDGYNGIYMSNKTIKGTIFEEVQYIALELNKRGILLGLCSKNNQQDVDEVISNHPDMRIREGNITIKKINWDDKVSNIIEIAKELNIGLDCLVYVDDSDFEVNYVRKILPQVIVLKVPKKLHEYPEMLRKNLGLFYDISESKEDLKRSKMYRQQVKRKIEKNKFHNIDEYLKSLRLKLTIFIDCMSHIQRISQLTLRTNQFNLTTRRYTEEDIKKFIKNYNAIVFTFSVCDKFGDYGITGLCIVKVNYKNKQGNIDNFLMSCRVIGRNIEFYFFDYIIKYLKSKGIDFLVAKYIKTMKNQQNIYFYEKFGFKLMSNMEIEKLYRLKISEYKSKDIDYIGVRIGKKN